MDAPQITFESTYKKDAGRAMRTFEATVAARWNDEWFAQGSSPDVFRPELAATAMALCAASYNNSDKNDCALIANALATVGFEHVDVSAYRHRNEIDPSTFLEHPNRVAYAFGIKRLPDGRPLVGVVVRGTSRTVEWVSNADVANGLESHNVKVSVHRGFQESASEMERALASYLAEHQMDATCATFFLTGHSKGGAVAGLAAARLINGSSHAFGPSNVTPDEENPRLARRRERARRSNDSVFAYTFATPAQTTEPRAHHRRFAGIFNVVDPADYVPCLPLEAWGFHRLGRTLFLPNRCTGGKDYPAYAAKVDELFGTYARTDRPQFEGFRHTVEFRRTCANLGPTLVDAYRREHYSLNGAITFAEYFRMFANLGSSSGAQLLMDARDLAVYAYGPLWQFLGYFMKSRPAGQKAIAAHTSDAYVARMEAVVQLGIDLERANQATCRRIRVFGPVSFAALNVSGDLVALWENGVMNPDAAARPDRLCVTTNPDDASTSLWVPDSGVEAVVVQSHADGAFDVLETVYDAGGRMVEATSYRNVALQNDAALEWDLEKATLDGVHLTPADACEVMVATQGAEACEALGQASILPGDHATVYAYKGPHLAFKGWYRTEDLEAFAQQSASLGAHAATAVDDTSVTASATASAEDEAAASSSNPPKPLSTKTVHSFPVTGPTSLTAVFTRKIDDVASAIQAGASAAGSSGAGIGVAGANVAGIDAGAVDAGVAGAPDTSAADANVAGASNASKPDGPTASSGGAESSNAPKSNGSSRVDDAGGKNAK